MAGWRIELTREDVAELSRGGEITVTAIDEDQDTSDGTDESIEVAVTLLEV